MPTLLFPADYMEVHRKLSRPPVYLNDLRATTEADRAVVRDMICTRFTSDMFSLVPSCLCGARQGEHLREAGVICTDCGQPVLSQINDAIESHIWIRQPQGCAPLISPLILSQLMARFTSGINVIRYIIDPNYSLKGRKVTPIIAELPKRFPVRGYNYFVENFDAIMESLFEWRELKKGPKKAPDETRDYLKKFRHLVFTEFLPAPNRSLLYIEEEAVAKYMYESTKEAIDILTTVASIDRDYHDQRPESKANRMGRCLLKYAEFYEKYRKDHIGRKRGMMRAQLLTSRGIFTSRMVISILDGLHDSDDIRLPWVSMVVMFQHHISAYLARHGLPTQNGLPIPSNAILSKIYRASRVYDPDIDIIMTEILQDNIEKYGGIPAILSRPPKLLQSSSIRVKIVGYSRDPYDFTMQISARICPSLNAK